MVGFAAVALSALLGLGLTPALASPADVEATILADALVALEAELAVVEQLPANGAVPDHLGPLLIEADAAGIDVLRRADEAGVRLSPQARLVLDRMPNRDTADQRVPSDYDTAIEMIERRAAEPNQPLPLDSGVDSTNPPGQTLQSALPPVYDDAIDLIDQAVEALESGDLALFDALGAAAVAEPTFPPFLDDVFAERDVESLLNVSEILRESDLEVLSWAIDAIESEYNSLVAYSASPSGALFEDLEDADDDGAGLLWMIEQREIGLSPAALAALEETDPDDAPPVQTYVRALDELSAMYDNDIVQSSALTDEMLTPSDADSTSSPIQWVLLGILSLAAVGLGLFALLRNRQAGDFADIANTDGLTGLNNRRKFDADVNREAGRGTAPTALLMIDVDHFKHFNDTHGHAMGDEVLRLVGETVASTVRDRDLAYRYGGEEFSVLLPDTSDEDAAGVAERLRASIAAIELPVDAQLTASVGVCIGPADHITSILAHADAALYDAKAAGRNRVAFAAPSRS